MMAFRICSTLLGLLSVSVTGLTHSEAAFLLGTGNHDWIRFRRNTGTVRRDHPRSCDMTSTTIKRSSKDWDAILSDDGDETEENIPPDMKYLPRNCKRQNQNFLAIRQAGGPTHDIYIRQPNTQVFWFVGKVAAVSDVSAAQAVARQWPLIETHAANLRPLELYPHKGQLDIWTAPGDSEMEVAYNRPNLKLQRMERVVEGADGIKSSLIGFQGEIYEGGEDGFRTWRLEDGSPAKPEVQSPSTDEGPMRAPTPEEMEEIQKALEGKDINAIYEEQQRRKREE